MITILKSHMQLWRVHKPIGFWLVLWPGLWALQLARPVDRTFTKTDVFYLLLFTGGAFFLRSAGCIINDIFDRRFDHHVQRTQKRPLVSGALSLSAAITSLSISLTSALFLWFLLPAPVHLFSLYVLPLIFVYPLMKRITHWPQLFLSVTWNWSILMGWQMYAPLDVTTYLLYIAGIFWTLSFDTIYAMQDKVDDLRIGVKSLAIILGDYVRPFALICTSLFCFFFCLAVYKQGFPWIIIALFLLAFGDSLRRIAQLDLQAPQSCHRYFIQQGWFGAILFIITICRQIFYYL